MPDVRFGSKADVRAAKRDVRFTPNSDRESRHPQTVMSALPPKADMCAAIADVRFGPIADMVRLLDQLVSALLQKQWHVQAKLLRRLKIDGHHEFRR